MNENAGRTPELSIVMPCLNEAETVAVCIREARQFLHNQGIAGEIIVADNGSRDGAPAIAAALGVRVVSVPEKGYGSALQGGIVAARAPLVIVGDADASYDFSALEPFVEKLRAGHDLVVGNRFRGGIEPGAMPPLHRYLGNPLLSRLARLMFGGPCRDFHCGLRGMRRDAILQLDLRATGMEYASEMIVKARLAGLRLDEAPTRLRRGPRARRSHLRSWRDGWRHLRFLLLYSPRWLFLYPGAALMLIGAALMAWLIARAPAVEPENLGVLIYAAASVVVGFQAINFSVIARFFAISVGLLPRNKGFDRLFRFFNLELGLLAGAALLAAGLALCLYAALAAGAASLAVAGATAFTLGFQIALSSFFLSLIGLKRK